MKKGKLEVINLLGKIDKEKVFVGNLRKCTKYDTSNCISIEDSAGITTFGHISIDSEVCKEDDILIKICDNLEVYVRLRNLQTILSYIEVYNNIAKDGAVSIGEMILSTSSTGLGSIFVDMGSLKPYYQDEKGKVKVKQIKKDVLLDPRIKGGIEN